MTAQATARNIRVAPRKARLVVDLIRGKNVVRAMAQLSTLRNRAAEPVMKVLQSLKRFRPRAMGRASGIKKRSSHITLEIGE